jgi:tRNA A37 threonylcarbamoyladenosine dehydratase
MVGATFMLLFYLRAIMRYMVLRRRCFYLEGFPMPNPFSRTELLVGAQGLRRLASARVAIFGLGGVGSYAVEALARSGVGHLVLIDHDRVSLTNLNRQLPATLDTLGLLKVDVVKRRVGTINPKAMVETHPIFYTPEKGKNLLCPVYDYIIDAVDTVAAKVDLITRSRELGIPIVSSMGAGNRLDPEAFQVADISDTHTCPLARIMRRELRRRGVTTGVKVVFSSEPPLKPEIDRGRVLGSIAFVPPVAGLLLAGVVVRELLGIETQTT